MTIWPTRPVPTRSTFYISSWPFDSLAVSPISGLEHFPCFTNIKRSHTHRTNAHHRATFLPSSSSSFIHNKLHNIKIRKYRTQTQLSPCKLSYYSNGALIASSTKTHARKIASQNYNKTTAMCWDGMLLHSPKSLSRRAFDHSQPCC